MNKWLLMIVIVVSIIPLKMHYHFQYNNYFKLAKIHNNDRPFVCIRLYMLLKCAAVFQEFECDLTNPVAYIQISLRLRLKMCVCLVGGHGSVLYGTCCREPQSSSCGGGEEAVSRSCDWGERRTGSRASEKRGWTRLWNRKQWQHAPACSQRAADQSSAT